MAARTCCRCGGAIDNNAERICAGCRKPPERTLSRTLTFRETQIALLVREAKANKQIAFELGLTEGTIKEYMNRIFRKLEIANRTQLAMWAMRHLPEAA